MAQSMRDSLDEMLDADYNLGEFDTEMSLVPPDTVAKATVISVKPIRYRDKETGDWNGMIEMIYRIDDIEVKEKSNLDDPRVVHTFRVDLANTKDWDGEGPLPLAGGPNKNIELGKVRRAFGMNTGKQWRLSHFQNQQAYVRVARNTREGDQYARVAAVGSARDEMENLYAKRK